MVDGLGNPLRFILSSGNRNDICLAKERSEQIALNMLADGKLSVKDIAKYSGLTVTEVKALAKKKSA